MRVTWPLEPFAPLVLDGVGLASGGGQLVGDDERLVDDGEPLVDCDGLLADDDE